MTPGHDFNDYEVGKRAGTKPAEMLNMFDATAHVIQTADGLIPEALLGLDRFEARKQVIELLEAEGALEKTEDRTIATLTATAPRGDRAVADRPMYVNVAPRTNGDGGPARARSDVP